MNTDEKTIFKLSELIGWDKNPRDVDDGDLNRLKNQLRKLGQYKPQIVTLDKKGRPIVLGGNMRLRALHEIAREDGNEADAVDVWCSIVDAPTDALRLEYALSDNDRAGHYQEDELVKLMRSMPSDLSLEDYRIDTAYTLGLDQLASRYDMADTRQGMDAPERGAAVERDPNLNPSQMEKYANATIKQIVLYFGAEEYAKALEDLQEVITDRDLENNTEAVLYLLKYWKGEA